MKTYPVHETEMDMIGALNNQTTIFFSLGSLAMGFALSIWTSAAFYAQLTAMGQLASLFLAPLIGIVGFVFYGLAINSWSQKRGLWHRIKSESAPIAVELGARSLAISGAAPQHRTREV